MQIGNRCAIGIDEVDNQGQCVMYLLLTKRFLCCSAAVDKDTAARVANMRRTLTN